MRSLGAGVTIDTTRCASELLFDGVAPEAVFEGAGDALARIRVAVRECPPSSSCFQDKISQAGSNH